MGDSARSRRRRTGSLRGQFNANDGRPLRCGYGRSEPRRFRGAMPPPSSRRRESGQIALPAVTIRNAGMRSPLWGCTSAPPDTERLGNDLGFTRRLFPLPRFAGCVGVIADGGGERRGRSRRFQIMICNSPCGPKRIQALILLSKSPTVARGANYGPSLARASQHAVSAVTTAGSQRCSR